jgi:glucan phosphoethanolaminetransferase (alkaline phosphatase superfamily)
MFVVALPFMPYWIRSWTGIGLLFLMLFGALANNFGYGEGYVVCLLAFLGLFLSLFTTLVISGQWPYGITICMIVAGFLFIAIKTDWDFRPTIAKLTHRATFAKFIGVTMLYLAAVSSVGGFFLAEDPVWAVPLVFLIACAVAFAVGRRLSNGNGRKA